MYSVVYHREIVTDLDAISTTYKRRIKSAIEAKLMTNPVHFGKPLQYSLRGLRSLRVGDYRVVFLLQTYEVYIVLIAHRSVVYERVSKRV
jgi:mRNA interferase RelE/StbE